MATGALRNRKLDNFDGEVVAAKSVNEAGGCGHAELRDDVGLHRGRGRGCEREHRNAIGAVAQRGQILSEHAVVGAKIVTPLRDAVRLVNGDERGRTLGEHLRKSGNAKAFGRDEKKVECAGEIVDAGLARDGAVEAGVDARHAQVECGELRDLVFHERDQRRDDERGSAESDGGKLVAERLPCPGGHDQQQVAALDGGAADRLPGWRESARSRRPSAEAGRGFPDWKEWSNRIGPSECEVPASTLQKRGQARLTTGCTDEVTSLVQQIVDLIAVEVEA